MRNLRRLLLVILALALLGATLASATLADGPATGEDYSVQAGDWLARIALSHYGDYSLYPAIVLGTAQERIGDPSYADLSDPYRLEIGDKLYLPPLAEAEDLGLHGLSNATYPSEWAAEGELTLVNGAYEEAIVPGSASKLQVSLHPRMAFGWTDDGMPWAAVITITQSSGSGTFYDLHRLVLRDGVWEHEATASIGDRVQVGSLAVDGDEIVLEQVVAGPDDPMCCPTLRQTRRYGQVDAQLVWLNAPLNERLVGTSWEWSAHVAADGSMTAIDDPDRYTLAFLEDGKIALRVDCNRAFGNWSAAEGLLLEVLGMTRAACPPDSLADDYAAYLADVVNGEIIDGELVLTLSDGGKMVFRSGALADKLVDSNWAWEATVSEDGTVVEIAEPERYTIAFFDEGRIALQIDCNRGNGTWSADNGLSTEVLITTLAACPEDSLDDELKTYLAEVVDGELIDGQLELTTASGATLRFTTIPMEV